MRYLSDFVTGQRFEGGPVDVATTDIIEFAKVFDPQPFHTDPRAAEETFFDGLAASGWMTAALTMRMVVGSGIDIAWGVIGREVQSLGWPRPVRPGDRLRVTSQVLEIRPSSSRPDRGTMRLLTETFNQREEVVQTMTSLLMVPVHPRSSDA
jgi:acyl dehydratase